MDGSTLHIGIVQARFNPTITQSLANACLSELHALKVNASHIHYVQVPGALEVPVALAAMAKTGEFDALVAGDLLSGARRGRDDSRRSGESRLGGARPR